MKRIAFHLFRLVALACLASPLAAAAQAYPAKPVRVLVPFAAGSIPDLVARLVSDKMTGGLGQPVLVENRIGAGGRIAAEAVARTAPDGYTLLLGTNATHVIGKFLTKNMPYDPEKDFTAITAVVETSLALAVHLSVPAARQARKSRTMGPVSRIRAPTRRPSGRRERPCCASAPPRRAP